MSEGPAESITVVLGHGAGGHMDHKTVVRFASLVSSLGCTVVRFNFEYRVRGKGMPDRIPKLIATYAAVLEFVRTELKPSVLIIGGHSMGGRVASMLEAESSRAQGLLLFGYPLHPPGSPDKLRSSHLPQIQVPVLQLSGTNDEFCTPELMEAAVHGLKNWELRWVNSADHGLTVRRSSGRTNAEVDQEISDSIKAWVASP